MEGSKEELEQMEARISELESRLGNNESKVSSLESNHSAVASRVSSIENRLNRPRDPSAEQVSENARERFNTGSRVPAPAGSTPPTGNPKAAEPDAKTPEPA